ncbi:MAG TPA: UbiA family prenyltransferase [Galbitalea sp.]|jgi:4-hydroxybenzoate polyprenyltransferase|nr:UbiA family prenyltransferase [Galbitalea sp.]
MSSKPVALARSTHPGPSVAVTLITVGLGFGAGLDAFRLVFLGLAMLAGQLSVGLSNDWIDSERDAAVGREDKPIVSGEIGVMAVRTAAFVCAAMSIALSLPLGWAADLALLGSIGAAWAYNAWLKRSIVSVLAYAVGFGLLPAIATLARPVPVAPTAWALAVGALLGIAAHFANTLPDLDDDAATGIVGLPQRLGRRWSSALTYAVLLVASILEFLGTGGFGFLPADIGLGASLVIVAVGAAMILRPTRWHFRLIILAAMVDVVVLIFAGANLLE